MAERNPPHLQLGEPPFPHCGDFEASGLSPESYPVEVAWSRADGTIASRLIKPDQDWDYWDPVSESMHGISRLQLELEGRPASEVAASMNADLAGEVLYFDGGAFDRFWLSMLFEAGGVRPAFRVGNFNALLGSAGPANESYRSVALASALQDMGSLKLHRAGNDVWLMLRFYTRVRDGTRGPLNE